MNERQYIQQLLDRFMEGITSEQEEQLLADYFTSMTDIPEEWRAYAVMFRGFQQKSFALKSRPAKVIPLKRWMVVAACAAGFVAILLMPPREKEQPTPRLYSTSQVENMQIWQYSDEQTPIDAQIAYQQEIKRKGERLAAYIQEQTKTDYDY